MTGVQTCALPIYIPLTRVHETISTSWPAGNTDVTVHTEFNLDTPPGEDIIAELLSKGVSYLNKVGGWEGALLGGVWDIINSAEMLSAYMEPMKDMYSEYAYKAKPIKRFDSGTIQSLYGLDRKSTRLNSSHIPLSRMPSSA